MNLLENGCTELIVCDSETLDRWDDAIVLSISFVYGDLKKRISFEELVEKSFFMKFRAKEQVAMGRKVGQTTMDWWKGSKVSDEARKMSFIPDPGRDVSVREFYPEYMKWCHLQGIEPFKIIHTDRNLFDLRKIQHILEVSLSSNQCPWDYHNIIDVTSTLRAWGADRYAGVDARTFPGMCYHDPRHDAALDWLRVQATAEKLGLLEIEG